MAEYPKEFKEHLENLVNYWKPQLFLHHYDISFKYHNKQSGDTEAQIIVTDCYFQGTITIFPQMLEAWEDKNYTDIENTIVHKRTKLKSPPNY